MNLFESIKGGNKRKEKFSEPYFCSFTKEQMDFIEERSKVFGSKAGVVRRAIEYYRERNLD